MEHVNRLVVALACGAASLVAMATGVATVRTDSAVAAPVSAALLVALDNYGGGPGTVTFHTRPKAFNWTGDGSEAFVGVGTKSVGMQRPIHWSSWTRSHASATAVLGLENGDGRYRTYPVHLMLTRPAVLSTHLVLTYVFTRLRVTFTRTLPPPGGTSGVGRARSTVYRLRGTVRLGNWRYGGL